MAYRLTDNEIVKALECCYGSAHDKCRNCPLENVAFCEEELQNLNLDLINRQKDVSFGYGKEHYTEAVSVIEIDNLLAELTGEIFTKVDHNSLCETETYQG